MRDPGLAAAAGSEVRSTPRCWRRLPTGCWRWPPTCCCPAKRPAAASTLTCSSTPSRRSSPSHGWRPGSRAIRSIRARPDRPYEIRPWPRPSPPGPSAGEPLLKMESISRTLSTVLLRAYTRLRGLQSRRARGRRGLGRTGLTNTDQARTVPRAQAPGLVPMYRSAGSGPRPPADPPRQRHGAQDSDS